MKRRLKAGVYDPFLDILGGGERHILSILQVFKESGYEIDIFWDKEIEAEIKGRFSLSNFERLNFLPNIFNKKGITSTVERLWMLKDFDIFFYVTDGSYFFSSAKKNFIFAMVPQKNLYNLNLLNRIKLVNFRFITNSNFTKNWLSKWGVDSTVVYPYIDSKLLNLDLRELKKEKIILSVGRFFGQLHSKKHTLIIDWFKKFIQKNALFKDFKLILAGGVKEDDKSYLSKLKQTIKDNSAISLKENISFEELLGLYKKAFFLVHFTGFGEDEYKKPQLVEHLGIVPLEAMAAGCITCCYRAGGPKEIINDGINGFLFSSRKELLTKMVNIYKDREWRQKMIMEAKNHLKNRFSYNIFKRRIREVFLT